jgi:hypothetical protein
VLIDVASLTNQAGETRPQYPEFSRHCYVCKNPGVVWEDFTRLQHQVLAQATGLWVGSARDRLRWLAATPDADSWLATYRELNALVEQRHGAEFETRRRAWPAAAPSRSWAVRPSGLGTASLTTTP